MKEFIENLIEKLNDPNVSEEAKELIRDLLRQQVAHEQDLLDQINAALRG
jgi:Arc/MetJ-type ribon-helix-helix transcriptional regulator